MKQKHGMGSWIGLAMVIAFFLVGCASSPPVPEYPNDPLISAGLATIQSLWNEYVPATKNPITGQEINYKFDGDVWYQQEGGKDTIAGKMILEKIGEDGFSIDMRQTHVWIEERKVLFITIPAQWQKVPEKQQKSIMKLEYAPNGSPPLKLSL